MEPNFLGGARRRTLALLIVVLSALIAAGCEISFGGGLSLDGDICEVGEGDAKAVITRDRVDEVAAGIEDLVDYTYEDADTDDVEWAGSDLQLEPFEAAALASLTGMELLRQLAAEDDVELDDEQAVERIGEDYSELTGDEVDGDELLDDLAEETGTDRETLVLLMARPYLEGDLAEEVLDEGEDPAEIDEYIAEEAPTPACHEDAVLEADDGISSLELEGAPVDLSPGVVRALETVLGDASTGGEAAPVDETEGAGTTLDSSERYDEVVSQDLAGAANVLVGFQKTTADLEAGTIDLAGANEQWSMHAQGMRKIESNLRSYSIPGDDAVAQAHLDLAAAVGEWAAGVEGIASMQPGSDTEAISAEVDQHMNQATTLLGSWGEALDAAGGEEKYPKIMAAIEEINASL